MILKRNSSDASFTSAAVGVAGVSFLFQPKTERRKTRAGQQELSVKAAEMSTDRPHLNYKNVYGS